MDNCQKEKYVLTEFMEEPEPIKTVMTVS